MRLDHVPRLPIKFIVTKGGRLRKIPLIKGWQNWPDAARATTNPAIIEAWRHEFRGCSWGLLCGVVMDVLDIDGDEGLAWLREHESSLTLTHVQISPRGPHFYFKAVPGLRPSTGKIHAGVDVKATGSFATDWQAAGFPTIDRDLAEWPEWLLALAFAANHHHSPLATYADGANADTLVTPGWGGPPSEYERNYAHKSLSNACRELRDCPRGSRIRNKTLNALAYKMGRLIVRNWIVREWVESRLLDSCEVCGLLADDGPVQCRATIASGINAGMSRPYHDIEKVA
jgi:hypothetical protein